MVEVESPTFSTRMLDKSGRSVLALMVAFLAAIFAFQLNVSMLSPVLTTMSKELHTTDTQIALTQTIFFTAAALFSLFLPRLSDLIGRKKVLSGILISTLFGSIISALAQDVNMLMLGRILQGASGPVLPMCLIMLRVRVQQEKSYAKLMAILSSVNGGIAGFDALLGGWLASKYGFRSVFWIMASIAAIAVIMIIVLADESRSDATSRMDWLGVVTLGIAFLAIYLSINELSNKLAKSNWLMVLILVLVAVLFFAIFWKIEVLSAAPLVSTTYMKQRRTWGLLLCTLLTMTGVFALINGVVIKLANDSKFGANIGTNMVSFVTLTPYAIIGLLFGTISGVLAANYGYRLVLRIGIAFSMICVAFGVYVAYMPSAWALVLFSVWVGVSYSGMANIMLNGLGIVLSPKDNPGYLPGMNAGAFNLGAGLSFAILYVVMTNVASLSGVTCGYAAAMVAGVVLLAFALACSFLIPDPKAADK